MHWNPRRRIRITPLKHGAGTAAGYRCDPPLGQGCQYTSIAFGMRCREAGVQPSMGSVGDCYDNAMCESFFATLECELLDRVRFRTPVSLSPDGSARRPPTNRRSLAV